MAIPKIFSPIKPHFFQPLLPGFHQHLNIPERFFKKHVEERNYSKTATLRSDVSYRTWEVKLDGLRFTVGWEKFAVDHDLQVGDTIVFRHEGGLVFHVTAFGTSFCNLQYASLHSDDDNDDAEEEEEEEEDNDEDYDVDDDEDHSDEEDRGNGSSKKRAKKNPEVGAESSPDHSCFVVRATASNLHLDFLSLPINFARSNGLDRRWDKIALKNEQGRSWTLDLRHIETTGQVYIMSGWASFCRANGLKDGSVVTLNLVQNGETPVLQLSQTQSSNNENKTLSAEQSRKSVRNSGECSKMKEKNSPLIWKCSSSPSQNRFVILTLRPYYLKRHTLYLPIPFTRVNGIERPGRITLLDKQGVEWPINMWKENRRGTMALGKGFADFCSANGVDEGEPFLMELNWRDTTPILKFCHKIQQENHDNNNDGVTSQEREAVAALQQPVETQQQKMAAEEPTETHKRVRVLGPVLDPARENISKHRDERCTDATSTKGTTAKSSPVRLSNLMAKAEQSIAEALTAIRQFQEVLATKEENLEASLQKLVALGQEN